MKVRFGIACVISAISAVSLVSVAQAADLRWDADASGGTFGTDGSGNWDLSTPNWNDVPATTNVNWIQGSNAIFGDPANTTPVVGNAVPFAVSLFDDIVVTDIDLNTASNGGNYNFDAPNFNSLTVNGNIYKNSAAGQIKFDLLAGPFVLGAGNHVFALRDTGGDVPEMQINANISGSGGFTIDNRLAKNGQIESWGTLSTTGINSYAGQTNLKYGRLVISQASGLGTTDVGTVISEAGTLSIGGPGVSPPSSLTISEPILITRNTYAGGDATDGGAFSHYQGAIISGNDSGTTTFTGPFVIDSTDARVRAQSSTLVIASNITTGANTASVLSIGGDTAGFVRLTGNNTALALGGVKLNGGELIVDNDNQIGGASAPLNFDGGYVRFVGGYLSNFGSHVVNTTSINGGVDVAGVNETFTINQNLTGVSFSMRGLGTLTFNGNNVLTNDSFFDDGIVNFNASHSVGGVRTRRATINVVPTTTLTAGGGGIQIATESNENSTLNQTGGSITSNRGGQFSLTIGGRTENGGANTNTVGTYNKSGGTLLVAGETFISNRAGTTGTWNHSGGTSTLNSWFVVGRQGGTGTLDLSGGTIVRGGGGNTFIDEGNDGSSSVATVRNAAVFQINNGELWVGNDGGTGTLNLQDTASVSLNNWFAIGRANGIGTFNMSGGTFTKTGNGNYVIGTGGNGVGTINHTGGSVTANNEVWLSEGGTSTYNHSGGTALFNDVIVGFFGGADRTATVNISGTAAMSAVRVRLGREGAINSVVNLSGGSLSAGQILPDPFNGTGSSGTRTFAFTGGTLAANSYSLASPLANSGTGVLSPGVIVTASPLSVVPGVGTLTIANGYSQAATASIKIELASALSNDSVVVTAGSASLAGPVNLSLLNGYVPSLYTPVSIVTAPSVTGIFSSVGGIVASPTRRLAVTYNGTSVLVQAAAPGDANLNGVVEFQDLVALAQNYTLSGKSWVTGDFTGDGTVEFQDLVLLAQFYNQPATFTSDWAFAQSIAPEPASLMVLGFAGLLGMRKRSR